MSKTLPKRVPALKAWLENNNIEQQELVPKTRLCMTTIHKIVNTGIISGANLKLLAFTLGFTDKQMADLLKTEQNIDHFKKLGF